MSFPLPVRFFQRVECPVRPMLRPALRARLGGKLKDLDTRDHRRGEHRCSEDLVGGNRPGSAQDAVLVTRHLEKVLVETHGALTESEEGNVPALVMLLAARVIDRLESVFHRLVTVLIVTATLLGGVCGDIYGEREKGGFAHRWRSPDTSACPGPLDDPGQAWRV